MSIRDTIKDNLINYWDWFTGDKLPVLDRLDNCNFESISGNTEDVEIEIGEFIDKSVRFTDEFHYINSNDFSINPGLVTVSVWFRVESDKTSQQIWWQGTTAGAQQLFISVTNGDTIRFLFRFGISNITREETVGNLQDGSFHHALFTHDANNGGVRCYFDNSLIGTYSTSSNLGNNGTRARISVDGTGYFLGSVAEILVGEFYSDDPVTEWLYNNGDGRAYIDIVEGNFTGTAKFGSRAAKRVYAISKQNWDNGLGGVGVPIIESTVPDAQGEYEMRLPEGDAVYLQSHAFEPENWRGTWEAETAVDVDDVMFTAPSSNARVLVCTQAGTTASSAPEWPSSGTVEDGSAEWEVIGTVQQLAPITNYYEVGQ